MGRPDRSKLYANTTKRLGKQTAENDPLNSYSAPGGIGSKSRFSGDRNFELASERATPASGIASGNHRASRWSPASGNHQPEGNRTAVSADAHDDPVGNNTFAPNTETTFRGEGEGSHNLIPSEASATGIGEVSNARLETKEEYMAKMDTIRAGRGSGENVNTVDQFHLVGAGVDASLEYAKWMAQKSSSGAKAVLPPIEVLRDSPDVALSKYKATIKDPRGADRTSWDSVRASLANKIEENELYYGSEYELTTYGITIFMLPEANILGTELTDVTDGIKTVKDINGIIIAETAGTDEFYVENLEFTSIVGGTGQIATQFTFVIKSPFRADLVDYIFKSAAKLQIRNHHDIPFFMLINWKGRHTADSTPHVFETSRCFSFRIVSTSVLFEEGGSVYEVSAIKAQDHNFNQNSALIQEDMTLEGKTVQDMYEQLLVRLGSRYAKASDTTLMPDAYKIQIEPELASFELVSPKQDKTSDTSNKAESAVTDPKTTSELEGITGVDIPIVSNINNANSTGTSRIESIRNFNQSSMKRTFTFKKGTPVPTILGSILNTTKEVQSWVTGLKDPQADDSNNVRPHPADVERYYYKIDPETVYGAYDPNRRKYSVKMIYKITKHLDPGLSVDEETTKQTKPNSMARLAHILDLNLLKKAYPYYYSGLNTEVKNLEYKFDNHWIVAKSLHSKLSKEQQFRHGVLADEFIHKGSTDPAYQTLRDKWVVQMQDLEAKIEKIDSVLTSQAVFAIHGDQGKLDASKGKKKVLTAQLDNIKLQMAQAHVIAQAKEAGLLIPDTESLASYDQEGLIMQTGSTFFFEVRPKFGYYDEFGDLSSTYTGDIEKVEPEGVMFPVPFIDTTIPDNYHLGTNDDYDRGGNLLAETVAQREGGDMVTIELEIRGDPYWIPDPKGNTIKPAFQQPYLILLANQAMDYNAGGIMKIDERNGLNAVYNVIKVRNNFAGGEFTQVLECVRDVTIDINAVLAEPDKYVDMHDRIDFENIHI